MKFEFSNCFALQTPRASEAMRFYNEVLGFELRGPIGSATGEIVAGTNRFFFDPGEETIGPIFELIVEDLEQARDELLAHGCTVIRWEGPGKSCYIRDPFGFVFNIWQQPQAVPVP